MVSYITTNTFYIYICYVRNGIATLKPHLLDDFKMTLLPALIEQIKYVPLPPFTIRESKENTMVISNMVLSGDTLMPETIELKVKTGIYNNNNLLTNQNNVSFL